MARFAWLMVVLGLGLLPLASACHSNPSAISPSPPAGQLADLNFGDDFGYRLYFKNVAGKATLSPDVSAPSSAQYVHSESGVTTALGSMQGGSGSTWTFTMQDPLTHDLYLNLSKPAIVGHLWWSSTTQQLPLPRDSVFFRVSIYVGDRLLGGETCTYANPSGTTSSTNGWFSAYLNFRPESYKLPAGEKISVKITRHGGLSDFWVGTQDPRLSVLELRVASFDLAKSAVKLENNQLTFAGGAGGPPPPPEGETARDSGEQTPPFAFALAAVGALLVSQPRRRGLLIAGILVIGALAGCLGSEPTPGAAATGETGQAKPTSSGRLVADEALRAKGIGAVRGYVFNDLGTPLAKAHVVILGTHLFADTNGRGYYSFDNVSAGLYPFRVDKEKYLPLDRKIEVVEGKVFWLNVTLVPPSSLASNAREHLHDDWGEQLTIPLWESTFQLAGYDVNSNGQGLVHQTGNHVCYFGSNCVTNVPLPLDARNVPAGTGVLEVKLAWNPGLSEVKELGLVVTTAKSFLEAKGSTFYYRGTYLHPRAPNEPFRIPIFPDEADPGHQRFTRWSLQVWQPHPANLYTPWSRPVTTGTEPVHLTTVAHKGIVVPEPAHKDFWGNLTAKTILPESIKRNGCSGGDHPGYCAYWTGYADWKTQIAAGTKEIRGRLKWETSLATTTEWTLAYKPGNSPYKCCLTTDIPTMKLKRAEVVDRKPGYIDFKITLLPEETDPIYVTGTASNWLLFADDQQERIAGQPYSVNSGLQTGFTLVGLTLHRDPEHAL